VMTDSLSGSAFRYLAIELNRGDSAAAIITFNSALALAVAASGILLLPLAILAYLLPVVLQIPNEIASATRFLLISTSTLAFASLFGGTFGAASLIAHRFDLRNVVRSLTTVTRVGVVALCFMLWPASLRHVGIGLIISAIVGLAGDVLLWRRLTPQLRIQRRSVDLSRCRSLMGFSGWSAINAVGLLLLMQVDLLIVNALFGAEMTGRYAAVLLFPVLIYTVMEAVIVVLSPAIMARHALGDAEGVQRIVSHSIKLLALTLALPVGLLCGLGSPLLFLWLGPDFGTVQPLLVLVVSHLTITLATRPLGYVLTAHDKVRVQGLTTLVVGIASVGTAIALARFTSLGVTGVAAATALAWTVRNVVLLPSYGAVNMGLRWHAFYPSLALAIGSMAGVGLAGQAITRLWWPEGWLSLGIAAAGIALAYGSVVYTVGLTKADRAVVWELVRRRQSRDRAGTSTHLRETAVEIAPRSRA
jgi:membrane protein EpsK